MLMTNGEMALACAIILMLVAASMDAQNARECFQFSQLNVPMDVLEEKCSHLFK